MHNTDESWGREVLWQLPGAEGHWDGELVFNGPEFQFYKMDDKGGQHEGCTI